MKEQVAFSHVKELLLSQALFAHYDLNRKLILSCNASLYRIGTVLSHCMNDNSERPIGYA